MSEIQGELEGLRPETSANQQRRTGDPWQIQVGPSEQIPMGNAPFSGLEVTRFKPGDTERETLRISCEDNRLRLFTPKGEEIKDPNVILVVASHLDNLQGTKLVEAGNLRKRVLKYNRRVGEIRARRKRTAA